MTLRSMIALSLACTLVIPIPAMAAELDPGAFADKAARSDKFELAAARLVIEKGKSERVKEFADEMIRDHGKNTKGLQEAASEDDITLPDAVGPELEDKLAAVKPLSGPQLYAAYISTQLSVHTDAVEMFETLPRRGRLARSGISR